MSYSVRNFDSLTQNITFEFNDGLIKVISLKEIAPNYGYVNTKHYLNTKNNKIVFLDKCTSITYYDNSNNLYIKANQFLFDKWMFEYYPNSDNSKIFKILSKFI